MDVKFNFEFEGKSFFGKVFRPIAKVSFLSPKSGLWITTWMVIDTGADFTILPNYLSRDLQISLKTDCITDTTKGVGGEQTIYLVKSKISAKIGSIHKRVPIAFFSTNELPALLGRLGFLETVNTEFVKNRMTIFKN